jgi:hypothetical protein
MFIFSYWKRLWRWTTSKNLTKEELQNVLDNKTVTEALCQGLTSYKPNKAEAYSQLQSKYPDQTKLLCVVQILQNYIVSKIIPKIDFLLNFLYKII